MEKGNRYEIQVAEWVESELAAGNYALDPKLATVHRKPSYFSRDRNNDIIFDVSIEVSRRGGTELYWIWVWECKNYSQPVPVNDVEEFNAKLSQIGVNRAKGTMITPIGFDPSSLEFAKSKGIGLWRYVPPEMPVLIMEDARGVADADIIRGLTIPDTTRFRDFGSFYAMTCGGLLTTDEAELFRAEFTEIW